VYWGPAELFQGRPARWSEDGASDERFCPVQYSIWKVRASLKIVSGVCLVYEAPFRQVLVSLLNMPDRLDWKACMLTDDEDKAEAQAFKGAFAPFDPSA
jgi:hypothetical protein